jgi:hypothetical protein
MTETKEYYYLPLEDCYERIEECLEIRKVLKYYIQDNTYNDEAWDSKLMMLLTELYAINRRYVEIMEEIVLTPPSVSEASGQEVLTIDYIKYNMLLSYSKLMIVNEAELKRDHRVTLYEH